MLENDPLWYKNAIIYELHVRSFHDSAGDGVGDFIGLTQKLDYLQDLGITAIWLLPFYPSPLEDDGYDIADYTEVHPQYGKLRDFREFLEAAHQRGIRVITELVINHTSSRHPWFQRARRSPPGSTERNFYVWSDTPEKYQEARIIFKDFETSNWAWDPLAKAYYWHRFYSHQPDLNYDNPAVWDAIFPVVDFWLDMGVDGMRLDAVPYLIEREGTSCENLPETHTFLKALRKHIDDKYPNRMLLSEANQWPEDAVAYFGDGDESHMAFHFPLMPRMFMAIHMEDCIPIVDILAQTPAIPKNCQWCMFLRNHDELTLEMVTDEERDYMYRAYATDFQARINLGIRHRLAPLLGNDRRRIELMNGLLFSLPGTPVLYYGDEIGMGDNIYLGDRNGVRTPMQWSADRNAGFSRANPQRLYLPVIIDPEYHYEAVNVEAQQNNPNSLLWWMKRLISLRKQHKSLGWGSLEFLNPANRKTLAFIRRHQDEHILVVANLSRFVQHVELDLSQHQGWVPVEMFGRNAFPRIGKQLYPLAMAPHSFYWFALEARQDIRTGQPTKPPQHALPVILLRGSWEDLFEAPGKEYLEGILPAYLERCPWADGKARLIKSVTMREVFRLRFADSVAFVCILEVEYAEGSPASFVLPLTLARGDELAHLEEQVPGGMVARVQAEGGGILFDALEHPGFRQAILLAIAHGKSWSFEDGELITKVFQPLDVLSGMSEKFLPSALSGEDHTNVSVIFGDRLILKLFRRIEAGIHPEVESGRFLTERTTFRNTPSVLGAIDFGRPNTDPITLAILHQYVANEGTAWRYTLDELSRFFERVLALPSAEQKAPLDRGTSIDLADQELSATTRGLLGRYLESAGILGQRTAELHLALASETEDPAFAPEPFTQMYQRSIYQSMRNTHRKCLDRLRERLEQLPASVQNEGRQLLDSSDRILIRLHSLLERKVSGQRIRCHGNYNLCEVLFTGKDFVIIDFEGEQVRSLADRRVKRSPLRDVAAMLRSYYYAVSSALLEDNRRREGAPGLIRKEDIAILEPWGYTWYLAVATTFLNSYFAEAKKGKFLPATQEDIHTLLDVYLLDKSLHELLHELNWRPHWVGIPIRGLLQLLQKHS